MVIVDKFIVEVLEEISVLGSLELKTSFFTKYLCVWL